MLYSVSKHIFVKPDLDDWKKPDWKRKNLIRLGINQGQAYAWKGRCGRTSMGGWARRPRLSPKALFLERLLPYPDLEEEGMNQRFPISLKRNLRFDEPPYTRPVRTVVCEAHSISLDWWSRLHDCAQCFLFQLVKRVFF